MNTPVLSLLNENACGCGGEAEERGFIECICPTTGLVQIIGRKYAVRLLTVIGERDHIRFNDLKTTMDDMSSSTLTIRLAELESAGLVERQTFAETPPRVEYRLTAEGETFRRSLFSLSKFALRKSETPKSSAEH